MNIRMLQTVEDQVKIFAEAEAAETPEPRNDLAAQRGAMISRVEIDDMVHMNWRLPAGGEFAVGARQGDRLIGLGYAEAI